MTSKAIAKSLLEIKAVSVVTKDNLFTWASGIKSPIYCDNRLTMRHPAVRSQIADAFAQYIRQHYPTVEMIAGTATSGIPHAAWLAAKLNLPMVYVRTSAKQHGKGNRIEGGAVTDQRVILIEDLISTGGSSLAAAAALQAGGARLLAVTAIFSYNFVEAAERFAAAGIAYHTLTDYQTLLQVGVAAGYIKQTDVAELAEWSRNPRIFTPQDGSQ
ncbi:MAG: orotate phosphoribosyltransferase [Clostridiales bacterium]|nr:MAG: orotate phosphoribosyltransferase [Clostridiales bacterium]